MVRPRSSPGEPIGFCRRFVTGTTLVRVTVGAKCQRTQWTGIRAAAYTARVTAIAGIVRLISALAARPTESANNMLATGTSPWMSYQVLLNRPPNAGISGLRDHTASKDSPRVAAVIAPKISTTLVVIHLSGLIDWVHARRCVPASYSRDTSGAVQNIPARIGRAMRAPVNGGMVWK